MGASLAETFYDWKAAFAPAASAFWSSRLEYQTFRLFVGELEHEIPGESGLIALHRLVEIARRHTIELRRSASSMTFSPRTKKTSRATFSGFRMIAMRRGEETLRLFPARSGKGEEIRRTEDWEKQNVIR
jgi:hypothetical protein